MGPNSNPFENDTPKPYKLKNHTRFEPNLI